MKWPASVCEHMALSSHFCRECGCAAHERWTQVPTVMVPLLVMLWLAAAPDAGALTADAGCAVCTPFSSPTKAFAKVLEEAPLVLAVGEYHEVTGAPRVPSAIKRFTRELLPSLKGRATALVVETWMMSGRCGAVEKQANAAVEKTTKRPESTEDEVTTLLDRTWKLGWKNHILVIGCDDYKSMLDDAGELDPEASLLLVKRKVEEKALAARDAEEAAIPGRTLVLYGGALHNDLVPLEAYAAFSFGPDLQREVGHYVELDLLVPEYVDTDTDLLANAWFKPALALSAAGRTVLIHPAPHVYLLLFARTGQKPRH